MNEILYTLPIPFFNATLTITAWKLVGWVGVLMFGGRWFVQVIASHFAKRPVIPSAFWYISILGSAFMVSYFIWGKNDSVGIMNNLFPMGFAFYNLYLHYVHKKNDEGAEV
ncbi:MAG: lipid-A-disaccharide synthase N-terminal domain-containing protein [Blastochloris sp.]|jgi:lipid-A-disaccharide synthase-like uncharacterized protein|nr:lipid-A-disaccharide synthase N-terminal domain-containing protein [Blastochloris sp.]